MTQRYFAITTPGFEKQLADEVDAVGGRKIAKPTGGAEFDATHRVFYRSNYEARTANRIYLRVDEFRARDFPEVYNKVRRYQWERLLGEKNQVFIKAVSRKSRLVHTGRIAETAAHGLREHFTEVLDRPAPEVVDQKSPDGQYLLVRIANDRCQLSLDASGEHLFKRGWRQEAVQAPIRESLAAAILARAGWNPHHPLVDPVCGSGTFVIEGAWKALKRPPGDMRRFAFHRWQNFRQPLWDDVVAAGRQRMRTIDEPRLFGFDTDPSAIRAAMTNADIADVGAVTDFRQADIAGLVPPTETPGLVIANPPYGERLEASGGPRRVYQTLIDRFAEYFDGWGLGLILPADLTPSHGRLRFSREASFQNGGINVALWMARHK